MVLNSALSYLKLTVENKLAKIEVVNCGDPTRQSYHSRTLKLTGGLTVSSFQKPSLVDKWPPHLQTSMPFVFA